MKSTTGETAVLKRMLQATAECIPIERLGDTRTAVESEHLSRCARCQTEIALQQEFNESAPVSDEGAAVQWVVAEVRRRRDDAALRSYLERLRRSATIEVRGGAL